MTSAPVRLEPNVRYTLVHLLRHTPHLWSRHKLEDKPNDHDNDNRIIIDNSNDNRKFGSIDLTT